MTTNEMKLAVTEKFNAMTENKSWGTYFVSGEWRCDLIVKSAIGFNNGFNTAISFKNIKTGKKISKANLFKIIG